MQLSLGRDPKSNSLTKDAREVLAVQVMVPRRKKKETKEMWKYYLEKAAFRT